MQSNERDEIIFGFTEKEVKFLLMSLKCLETHGNLIFASLRTASNAIVRCRHSHHQMKCTCLAHLTGYSSKDTYRLYMDHLVPKIITLPSVDLTRGSDDQEHAVTAEVALQVPTPAVEEDGKKGSGAKNDEQVEKDIYKGIGDGVDGAGGDPEDEKELEALGSAYAWDC